MIVVAGAGPDAEILGDGDLHSFDPLAVPVRLDERVGKTEDQEVLNGVFTQIVIDPVDLRLVEVLVNPRVELTGGLQVLAERLLDDQPRPAWPSVESGTS